MIPVKKTNHVAEGLTFLTDQFKNKPNIAGLLTSWLAQFQSLEDVFWEIINERNINDVGAQLDLLGGLVGEARNGRSDAAYRPAIIVKILINRSEGSSGTILKILAAIANLYGVSPASDYIQYSGQRPARFRVVSNLSAEANAAIVSAMLKAKPVGVAFDFQGNGTVIPPGLSGKLITYDNAFVPVVPTGLGFASAFGATDTNASTNVQSY